MGLIRIVARSGTPMWIRITRTFVTATLCAFQGRARYAPRLTIEKLTDPKLNHTYQNHLQKSLSENTSVIDSRFRNRVCPESFLDVMPSFYPHIEGRFRMCEDLSKSFPTSYGIREGCPLSPLFHCVIDELNRIVVWLGNDDQAVGLSRTEFKTTVFATKTYSVNVHDHQDASTAEFSRTVNSEQTVLIRGSENVIKMGVNLAFSNNTTPLPQNCEIQKSAPKRPQVNDKIASVQAELSPNILLTEFNQAHVNIKSSLGSKSQKGFVDVEAMLYSGRIVITLVTSYLQIRSAARISIGKEVFHINTICPKANELIRTSETSGLFKLIVPRSASKDAVNSTSAMKSACTPYEYPLYDNLKEHKPYRVELSSNRQVKIGIVKLLAYVTMNVPHPPTIISLRCKEPDNWRKNVILLTHPVLSRVEFANVQDCRLAFHRFASAFAYIPLADMQTNRVPKLLDVDHHETTNSAGYCLTRRRTIRGRISTIRGLLREYNDFHTWCRKPTGYLYSDQVYTCILSREMPLEVNMGFAEAFFLSKHTGLEHLNMGKWNHLVDKKHFTAIDYRQRDVENKKKMPIAQCTSQSCCKSAIVSNKQTDKTT
ncbi:hypothetical protein CLF_103129, partial [Clonorchis sinensis]